MRFTIDVGNIGVSEPNDEVAKVQRYLYRFGYLKAGFDNGRLDSYTQDALKAYQRRVGITATGLVDEETAKLMQEPRCGLPDLPSGRTSDNGVQPFLLLRACKYEARELAYSIVSGPASFSSQGIKREIRSAFDTWQRVIPVNFREVRRSDSPTLTFTWVAGDHRDGAPFDGRDGNVIAHAFPPPKCGDPHAGQCHFDSEDRWGLSHGNRIRDIQTVALHEIGHLLGLGHSTDGVMFENYRAERRQLSQGDIDVIQALYGKRTA